MKLTRVAGIDLGSSNSSISRWGRGPEVINVDGSPLMPSVVTIVSADDAGPGADQIFIGLDGVEAGKRFPETCFTLFKRQLGAMWHADEDVGPQLVEAPDGSMHYAGPDGHTYSPVELCSMVIGKLLDSATTKFKGERPDGAVICVPATFSPSQRKAVQEAGAMAGLSYVELMDEPTAAALAYGYDFKKVRRIAVLDVGGGTTDVSIIQTGAGLVTVLATGGSSITGGSDIDAILARYIVNQWAAEHDGTDIAVDDTAMTLVLKESEDVKKRLSRKHKAEFRIKDFDRSPSGTDLHMDYAVDRVLLENLSKDLLARMRSACLVAISEAQRKDPKFSVSDLHSVVLVGGGTRMPAVQEMARQTFGQEPKTDIDPEVAVVLGAAIRAGVIEGRVSDLTVQDITSWSISVEVFDKVEGVAAVVIPKGTPYPSEKAQPYTLTNREAGQSTLPVRIVAGEHDRAAACDLLHAIDVPLDPCDPRAARVPFTVGLNSRGEAYGTCGEIEWGSP